MTRKLFALLIVALASALAPCGAEPAQAYSQAGIASYYWQPQMTANGERFDPNAMTAAHKTLPMGTRVRVTHVASGRSVVVRINDRGPLIKGRVIDLSRAAAGKLGMRSSGLAKVTITVIAKGGGKSKATRTARSKPKSTAVQTAVRSKRRSTVASRTGKARRIIVASTVKVKGAISTVR
jgi:rare lipoprotein A